jgi:enolase-phosphatase E1
VHGTDVHPVERSSLALSDIRAILLDIEGTTTPIEFVHQVLFPYARARVHSYLEQHGDDPAVRADVALLRSEYAAESPRSPDLPPWNPETYVYWLMDRDRKSTGLKALQGRIWEDGYRAGELRGKGEVYPDVRPALERWHAAGKTIAIFSSGSIQAQRNLFANTTAGDLSRFLSGYFDTTTGPKRDANSYRTIAAALNEQPAAILFVSDVAAELDAARAAGMRTALCIREPESPIPTPDPVDHPRIRSFAELA